MTSESTGDSEGDARHNGILAEFIQQTEAGLNPDPQEILARHPELAEELQEFFNDKARFDRMAQPFIPGVDPSPQPVSGDETLLPSDVQAGSMSSKVSGSGSKLRYFGDYELLEEIARGGMGVVYKSRQTTLKRIVALKMILSGQLAGEEAVARFYTEAEAAAKLDHPNIVPIFEIGQHDGQHYFSMTLVEGESLAHKLAAGPLPPRDAAQLMKKIAEAIAYAHVQGVIRRDLKPANVLLDKDGEPRVTDFGFAKHASAARLTTDSAMSDAHLTATGQILGTPGYMPPEQAAGKADEVGALSDVYSLGAMLYCLLTGRPPFQAANPLDTLKQVLHKEAVPVRQLNPEVPRDLETICLKCLEKVPHRRYATAAELANDLQRYLRGEPVQARPIGRLARTGRWCRRNPWPSVAAVALVVLTVVASFSAVMLRDRLWQSLSQQARAERLAGNRARSLELIVEAAAIRRNADLRQEAIETIITPGIGQLHELHMGHASRLGFSRDGGKLVATGSTTEVKVGFQGSSTTTKPGLRVWEFPSGRLLEEQAFPSGDDQAIPALVELTGGLSEKLTTPDGKRVEAVSNDGRIGAVLGNEQIEIWDLPAASRLAVLTDLGGGISNAAVTSDARLLAYHDPSEPGTIKLVDVQTGQRIGILSIQGQSGDAVLRFASPMEFSADGVLLAAHGSEGGTGVVRIWDIEASSIIATIRGDFSPAWSKNDHVLATIGPSEDERRGLSPPNQKQSHGTHSLSSSQGQGITHWAGFVHVWNVARPAPTYRFSERIFVVGFYPDGKRLAVNKSIREVAPTDNGFHLGKTLFDAQGVVWATSGPAWVIDNWPTAFHAEDKPVTLWQASDENRKIVLKHPGYNQELFELKPNEEAIPSLSNFAFSSDGKLMANVFQIGKRFGKQGSGFGTTGEQSLELWDPVNGTQSAIWNQDEIKLRWGKGWESIGSVAFSPDGKRLAAGGRKLTLWDVALGTKLFELDRNGAAMIAFLPDGRLAFFHDSAGQIGSGNAISVVDTVKGRVLRTVSGHRGVVNCLVPSSDGRTLASGGSDRTIRLWNPLSGQELAAWKAHDDSVTAVSFSPDGTTLASGSADGTVKFWHLPTIRKELAAIGLDWAHP